MNVSDWVLVLTSLFLGGVAFLAPAVSDLIKRRILAPNLLESFEQKPPFCLKTYWSTPKAPNLHEPVYYFRFQVTNTGKTQLRHCEAVLETIWIYDAAGRPQKLRGFSDVNLHWANQPDSFININPRRRVYCDVGHISSAPYQQDVEHQLFTHLTQPVE